jgi:hypothetical protein
LLKLLDVQGDVDRFDPLQPVDAAALAAAEKLPGVVVVGIAGVPVGNHRRKQFQKPPRGMLAGLRAQE